MKILFIARGDHPDYQSDTIFHGGRSLFGADFVDARRIWYMYKDDCAQHWHSRIPDGGKMYGRGFTLSGTLPEIEVDRTDIEHKIETLYYDYIIYGSVTRCFDYLPLVSKYYPSHRVIFIDGEDDQHIRTGLLDTGIMFKRELVSNAGDIHPTNFGIPKEKVLTTSPTKTRDWATVIPGKMETYIFDREEDYYRDYRESMFGITHKKGGWDCLRHYEILANGCAPYFPDINSCPEMTMTTFPKEKVANVLSVVNAGVIHTDWFESTVTELLQWTRDHLTTEEVVKQMFDKIHKR